MLIVKRKILVLGEDTTQRLDDTTNRAGAKSCTNFTRTGRKLVLSLHHNGRNSFLFVNVVKMYQFKAKDSEIKPYPLYLRNISKGFYNKEHEENKV